MGAPSVGRRMLSVRDGEDGVVGAENLEFRRNVDVKAQDSNHASTSVLKKDS